MDYKVKFDDLELTLSDADIVNPDGIEYADLNGRKGNSLFILHDKGDVVCAAWAYELSEAMDIASDSGMLDHYLIDELDYANYGIGTNAPGCSFLGDAGEPYDIRSLSHAKLASPTRSNCAELWASWPEVHNLQCIEFLSSLKRCEFLLRRIHEGDHRALENAIDVANEAAEIITKTGEECEP